MKSTSFWGEIDLLSFSKKSLLSGINYIQGVLKYSYEKNVTIYYYIWASNMVIQRANMLKF